MKEKVGLKTLMWEGEILIKFGNSGLLKVSKMKPLNRGGEI